MIVNWDLILNDLSVRLKNGTPDFKNEQHIIKLWDVLKEHKWPIEARVELIQTLQEKDIVKNKKSGNTYVVKTHNPETQSIVKKDASEKEIEKVKQDKEEPKTKGDHESKQKHISSGFVKGAAPGNAGSMYNEIMSGEVSDLLQDNPDATEEELVKSILDKYGDSNLAKQNSSNRMAGGLKTGDLPDGLPKEERELYTKTLIAVRSGKRKHQRSQSASKDLGWKNTETSEYFGDSVGLKKQEEDINSASKVVDLDGNEIPKDEIIELIKAGGGGDNPSDTATIIKNKDNGEATILFTSDKDSTNAIIAQSSTKAESTQTDDAILQLGDDGKISSEESEAIAGERRNYASGLKEIESKLKSVTSEPAKYINDNFESDDIDFMKSIGAGNNKYWDGDSGVIKKFKKSTNWTTERFDENGEKIEGQKHSSDEYLKEIGWNGESEPTEEQQAKAFILYATKVENPPKNVQRVISDLNKHKGGPNVDDSVEKIRKDSIELLDKQIGELDQIEVNGIGVGTYIEGNNIWKQGHMDAIGGKKGVHKYRGMFETNHAGVVLDGNVMKKALGVESKEDFLKKLKIEKTTFQKSRVGRVTGSTGLAYMMVGDKKVPIMEKRQRTKDGPLGKLQTVYKWTPEFQKLIEENQ